MNKGIKLSHGEWLNFMNGGDRFTSNDVLKEVFSGKEYSADVLYGKKYNYDDNGVINTRCFPAKLSKKYFRKDCICHQSSFIKRYLFKKYGMYEEKWKIVSDWEKWIVFAENNRKFYYLDMFIADFWLNGISSAKLPEHKYEIEQIRYKHYVNRTKITLFNFIPLLAIDSK